MDLDSCTHGTTPEVPLVCGPAHLGTASTNIPTLRASGQQNSGGHTGAEHSVGFQGPETQQGSMLTKLRQCMEQPEKDTEKDPEKTLEDRNLHGEGDCSFVWMISA